MSETSNSWTGPTLLDLMSYVEDTPANPSASPVRVKAKKTRATSGPGYEKPYAFYDPVTQSLKMYEATCPLAELPSLEKLPPSGMTRSGVLFLQPPWEPITDAIESSLWPTPTTQEVEHPNAILNHKGRRMSKDGTNSHSLGLADAVLVWPTPTASSWGSTGHRAILDARIMDGSITEQDKRAMTAGNGGKLNPEWVEWLMGFPIGWTDLEASETPSSPK
jgi:hypothetical protein